MPPDKRRQAVQEAVRALLARESLNALVRDAVAARVVDEVVGFGPIEPLLHDDSVSEVMVNTPEEVYFERDGKLYPERRALPRHEARHADHRTHHRPAGPAG